MYEGLYNPSLRLSDLHKTLADWPFVSGRPIPDTLEESFE